MSLLFSNGPDRRCIAPMRRALVTPSLARRNNLDRWGRKPLKWSLAAALNPTRLTDENSVVYSLPGQGGNASGSRLSAGRARPALSLDPDG